MVAQYHGGYHDARSEHGDGRKTARRPNANREENTQLNFGPVAVAFARVYGGERPRFAGVTLSHAPRFKPLVYFERGVLARTRKRIDFQRRAEPCSAATWSSPRALTWKLGASRARSASMPARQGAPRSVFEPVVVYPNEAEDSGAPEGSADAAEREFAAALRRKLRLEYALPTFVGAELASVLERKFRQERYTFKWDFET